VTQVISGVQPGLVVPGARMLINGAHLPVPVDGPPHVLVGILDAQVVAAAADRLRIIVPAEAEGGTMAVRIDELPGATAYIDVARPIATGVHIVDSPAFGADGRLYITHSGDRGNKVPTPLYRIGADGGREPLAVEIANPTSMAVGPDGALYISSRFEGQVYRMLNDEVELYASDLGVATGLAFGPDGELYVGDRSGSILRVTPDRQVETLASLPASVAAFHLAMGPDGALYVSSPTLATHDPIYRITPDRLVDVVCDGFGRPQGLAFDSTGALYVAEALAGAAGLYRLDVSGEGAVPELVVAAPVLVGVAFDPDGGLILASNDTVWRLDNGQKPLQRA
jgi:sugar lactone lactonase YvrE